MKKFSLEFLFTLLLVFVASLVVVLVYRANEADMYFRNNPQTKMIEVLE